MKKWIALLMLMVLLILNGCQPRMIELPMEPEDQSGDLSNQDEIPTDATEEKEPDHEENAEQSNEQKEPTGTESPEEQKEPSVTKILMEQERFFVKLNYQFDNEDSKALVKFMENLTYDSEICMCIGPYNLTVGEKRYNVAVAEGKDDCYIRIGGKQKNLTEAERDWVLEIFRRQLTGENRIPGEEEKVQATVAKGSDHYSFTGSDALLLADILDTLEYKKTTKAYSAPLRIEIGDLWLWGDLSAKEPYLFNLDGKMAYVDDGQLEKLNAVLDRICREEYLQKATSNPEVYVAVYGEPTIQYRFTNEDSRNILRWIVDLRFPYGETSECPCEATYRIYTGSYYYLSVQEDGTGHFYDRDRKRHIVISREDVQQLKEWFTPHCLPENEVKYYG